MTTRVIESDAREEERDEEREEERDEEREEDERWIDEESGGWDEDGDDAIPPRPRGRLLRPVPLALIAVIVAAAGFLGGVEAQKGSEGGSAGAAPGAGGLPGFAASKAGGSEAGGSESKAESSLAGLGGSSSVAATGTVTSVEGHTIYVKESDGTTVAVKVGDGATVTRDSNVAAKQIHPG
ncbi:MAG TPA: hypothetical protein VHA76_11440, partial [Solirubrobacterales bacterium]|nr:hypothetical protein [Solirubrobacterales bacterium]